MGRRKPSFRQAWQHYQNNGKYIFVESVLKTAPASEPISLDEVKTQLKLSLTSTSEDAYLTALLATARVMVERYLNRSLITQTWTGYSEDWCELCLPYAPIQSVTSVKYYALDNAGSISTLDTGQYWVDLIEGEVEFRYATVKPLLEPERPNVIEIEYVAGYGSSTEVPDPIKHAMKILITDMYENRGQYVIGSIVNKIPGYISDMIHSYKLYDF